MLRILDRDKGIVPLDALGLDPAQRAALDRILARPEGLILVVGPTGSGKTTTLYSMLGHLNTEAVNIMTLEDPVEYPLALIRQTRSATPHGSTSPTACALAAPGPRRDPDRRDPRRRHRHHGLARRTHRPPGVRHPARELDLRRAAALHEIGIGAELLAGNLWASSPSAWCAGCAPPAASGADDAP